MKIALYCFGASPIFLKEVIRLSGGIDWSAIVPTYHHRSEFEKLLGRNQVLYVQEKMNRAMKNDAPGIEKLGHYPGSVYADIAVEKGGLKKRKPKDYQLRNALNLYLVYKDFLKNIKPEAVFFPVIESYDGMILYKTCKELGIETIVYANARNLGCSFFSQTHFEDLPGYAHSLRIDKTSRARAIEFIKNFRENFSPPDLTISAPKMKVGLPKDEELIYWQKKPLFERASGYFYNVLANEEPHYVSDNTPFQKLKANLFPLTRGIRSVRGGLSKKYFEIKKTGDLPDKFIYYPLQATPESSINVPAPYFVDQMRAIDMILYSMPSDHFLVIKEHPAMLGVRPFQFYEQLKRKAGVILADPSLPSIELVKKAALTVSVTGSPCLEAFLMGKPSMHLGRTFFTDWIAHCDCVSMKETVKNAMNQKIDEEKIIDLVARTFMVSRNFILYCPTDPYLDPRYLMNKRNIRFFLEALADHMAKVNALRRTSKPI